MISIAIDGPAGAGKSTVAKAVAQRLKYLYVDTGALYRAIAFFVQGRGLDDETAIVAALDSVDVKLKFINDSQRVFLCNEDVTEKIRTPQISMMASKISAIPAVREFLLCLQRDIAQKNNVLMDGRDIGTVILPNADVKIFLTASPEVRAKRRYKELLDKGISSDYEDVLSDILKRDYDDSNRTVAPLKRAEDALLVDTSDCSFEESVELVLRFIEEGLRKSALNS